MRVVQAMAGARVGGAEAFFMRLVPALAEAGIEQRAVIRRHPDRARALQAAGVATWELRFGGPLDLASRWGFARALRSAEPDIAMTWMSRASAMCPPGRHVQIGRLGGYYDLRHYRRCRHLVGNTKGIVDHVVREGWPASRVHLISNFVETSLAVAQERAALDTPDDVRVVVALGRLHPNKAFDVLIDALAELPDVWLWLAGEGRLRALLEAHAADLGVAERVRFLGWRADVGALLAAAEMLVCPSRHEPLGNVVLEAWARRVPVVAAASQGPSELIEHGKSGLLVPVEDARALARAMRTVLDDAGLRRTMVEAGAARYEACFSRQAIVARYVELYRAVAD